jgi:hypothetical protein
VNKNKRREERKQRFFDEGVKAAEKVKQLFEKQRRPKESAEHAGITLGLLCDKLEEHAISCDHLDFEIVRFICQDLFPACKVTQREVASVLKRLRAIQKDCNHMVACDIYAVEEKLMKLSLARGRKKLERRTKPLKDALRRAERMTLPRIFR